MKEVNDWVIFSGNRYVHKYWYLTPIKQPNGLYAIWNVKTGDFECLDLQRSDLKDKSQSWFEQFEYYEGKKDHLLTWDKAIERIINFKSPERVKEILSKLTI